MESFALPYMETGESYDDEKRQKHNLSLACITRFSILPVKVFCLSLVNKNSNFLWLLNTVVWRKCQMYHKHGWIILPHTRQKYFRQAYRPTTVTSCFCINFPFHIRTLFENNEVETNKKLEPRTNWDWNI